MWTLCGRQSIRYHISARPAHEPPLTVGPSCPLILLPLGAVQHTPDSDINSDDQKERRLCSSLCPLSAHELPLNAALYRGSGAPHSEFRPWMLALKGRLWTCPCIPLCPSSELR
ncbi:unnamed protein product [Boreogadus saida]